MKKFFCGIIFFNLFVVVNSQVKIGTNPSVINSFSLLELEGNQKGLLLPRVATATDLALMTSAPEGMIIYFIPDQSLYIKQNSTWLKLVSSDWGRNSTSIYNTNTGFVGIGTSIPNRLLTVKTPAGGIGISQESPNGLTSMGFFVSNGGEAYLQTHSNDDLNFTTNNGQSQLVLKTNGNVGIGTITPNASLSVGRGTGVDGTAAFFGTTNVSHFNYSVNEDTYIRGGKATSNVYIGDLNTAVVIGSGGFLAGDKLTIWGGNLRIAGGNIVTIGNICASGTIGACSDIRFKTNISLLQNPLQKIKQLHAIFYNWKQDQFPQMHFNNERQLGLSAQEVEKLFPEIVQTNAEGFKAVDYGRLTPVLIEGMKAQQQQIESLQDKNADLKARLERLEKLFFDSK